MKRFRFASGLAAPSFVLTICLGIMRPAIADEPKSSPVAATQAKDRIEIRDFMFKPNTLTVKAGSVVTFINKDEEPHTVASADGKFTRSRALDTDQEFTVTLNTPGDYAYFCTVHPHMTGKITVTAP